MIAQFLGPVAAQVHRCSISCRGSTPSISPSCSASSGRDACMDMLERFEHHATDEFLFETADGRREMWPKLATIESNCGIEMQLDECVRAAGEAQPAAGVHEPQAALMPCPGEHHQLLRPRLMPPHAPDRRQHRVDHHRERQRSDAGLASSVDVKSSFAAARRVSRTLRTLDPRRLRREHVVSMSRESNAGSLSDFMHVVADQMKRRTGRPQGGERRPAEGVVPAAAATIDKLSSAARRACCRRRSARWAPSRPSTA